MHSVNTSASVTSPGANYVIALILALLGVFECQSRFGQRREHLASKLMSEPFVVRAMHICTIFSNEGTQSASAPVDTEFKLKQFLPGSVYLWACGEDIVEVDGDVPWMPPEAVTGWVVLIVRHLVVVA